MTEWEPIETIPKNGFSFLVYSKDTGAIKKATYAGGSITDVDCERFHWNKEQLLWMPLPAPPKKKHYCEGPNGWVCHQWDGLSSEFRIRQQKGDWFTAPFCPFCGEPSEN